MNTAQDNVRLDCMADSGCVRIDTPDMSAYFSNGFGDGSFTVYVDYNSGFMAYAKPEYKFVEHFHVKTTATVSSYDCDDRPVHTLPEGRYGVYYHKDDYDVYIVKWEK